MPMRVSNCGWNALKSEFNRAFCHDKSASDLALANAATNSDGNFTALSYDLRISRTLAL